MQPIFSLASSHSRHWCLGLELQPLTLGHVRLLTREKCGLLRDAGANIGDLCLAVFVCCQDWRVANRNLGKWWIRPLTWIWGWRCRKMDFNAEFGAFAAYFLESQTAPVFKFHPGEMRTVESPWAIRIHALLMSRLHMTYEAALDKPLIEAAALLACIQEVEDGLQLKGQNDADFEDYAKEFYKTHPRQEAVN